MSTDLTVTMTPKQYRICNDRPPRPAWMDELHPREAYKALTLMRLYELRAWEEIVEMNDCACGVRFPSWNAAELEFREQFGSLSQAEHTEAHLEMRNKQNNVLPIVESICEAQGNW